MTERERERAYFRILLVCVLVAPWVVVSLARSDFHLAWPHPSLHVLILFGSIPLTLVFELAMMIARGRKPRFMVANLVSETIRVSARSVEETESLIRERLASIGFLVEDRAAERPAIVLDISRGTSGPSLSFLDQSFGGRIRLEPSSGGTTITMNLAFGDTLLLLTGEEGKLRQLADYLCGEQEDAVGPEMHLVLGLGVACAVLVTGLGALTAVAPALADQAVTAATFSAIPMTLAGLFIALSRGNLVFCRRVGALALIVAIVPFAALMPGVSEWVARSVP